MMSQSTTFDTYNHNQGAYSKLNSVSSMQYNNNHPNNYNNNNTHSQQTHHVNS
jgi:hypothetical protein